MLKLIVVLLLVAAEAPLERPGDLVWQTDETVEKGGDKTFTATGTRKGHAYVFKAKGVCKWEPVKVWFGWTRGWVDYQKHEYIWGIDFRVSFGSDDLQVMNVGNGKTEDTAIPFVASRDDVLLRIVDHWDLPKRVICTVDNIEVVAAPLE